jgi:hypothetical protein
MYRFSLIRVCGIVLLAAGVGIGSLARAAATTTPTTYYACLASGKLYHVGTSKPTCSTGSSIFWDQTGPQGPQGPPGPAGPLSVTTAESPAIAVPSGSFNQITVSCPVSMLAIAGNYYVNMNGDAGNYPDLSLKYSGPTLEDNSWTAGVSNSGANAQAVRLHVMCATGSES